MYGKNQKKLMDYFGEMDQKDQFWPKTAKFGPKKSNLKKIWAFFKRPKNQFLWQKSEKNKGVFWRNGSKIPILAKNDQIWAKKNQI